MDSLYGLSRQTGIIRGPELESPSSARAGPRCHAGMVSEPRFYDADWTNSMELMEFGHFRIDTSYQAAWLFSGKEHFRSAPMPHY